MDLQTIRTALEAATKGPYQVADLGHGSEVRTKGGSSVAWCGLTSAHQNTAANARLFAHAPQWLSALVAEVEALRGALTLLVEAQDYKAQVGKTPAYEAMRSDAWEAARNVLAQTQPAEVADD